MVAKILLVYASRYGQTEKIATRIGDVVQQEGVDIEIRKVQSIPPELDLGSFDVVVLAGPVMWGWHPRALRRFIRRKLAALSGMRSILVSVSGAASSAAGRPVAEQYVQRLTRTTGWVPDRVALFGGGVPFTRYGFLTRLIMKTLEPRYGREADVTRDFDYTDWDAVDAFARSIAHLPSERRSVA